MAVGSGDRWVALLERDPRVLTPVAAGVGRLGYACEWIEDLDQLATLLLDEEEPRPSLVLVDSVQIRS